VCVCVCVCVRVGIRHGMRMHLHETAHHWWTERIRTSQKYASPRTGLGICGVFVARSRVGGQRRTRAYLVLAEAFARAVALGLLVVGLVLVEVGLHGRHTLQEWKGKKL